MSCGGTRDSNANANAISWMVADVNAAAEAAGWASTARVTTREAREMFHKLIGQYKATNARGFKQDAGDYQQEAEAAARRLLFAQLDNLALDRAGDSADTSPTNRVQAHIAVREQIRNMILESEQMGGSAQKNVENEHDTTASENPKTSDAGDDEFEDYRGRHSAPSRDSDAVASMDDLTALYPADVYSPNGVRLYTSGYPDADRESMEAILKARGNPDAEITVYRAVPAGVDAIMPGDWVTPSRTYAQVHGDSNISDGYVIVEARVKARDLFTEANSLNEWGWDPE